MAQANEVPIPKASQFILDFMKLTKVQKSNGVAKYNQLPWRNFAL